MILNIIQLCNNIPITNWQIIIFSFLFFYMYFECNICNIMHKTAILFPYNIPQMVFHSIFISYLTYSLYFPSEYTHFILNVFPLFKHKNTIYLCMFLLLLYVRTLGNCTWNPLSNQQQYAKLLPVLYTTPTATFNFFNFFTFTWYQYFSCR